MDTKTIRILKTLSTGLVIVAMIFAFLIAGIRIFGVQVYGVLTGSMEPTHPTGSLIYVKRTDASDLRVNDVITFSISPNVIATHRIVEIVPDETNPSIVRYRTKGDANKDVDASLVSASNIIGKVMFSIPQLGYIANFIQQPPGIYVAILVCGLTIAFVFYTDSLENKQKDSFRRSTRRGHAPQKRSRSPQAAQQNRLPGRVNLPDRGIIPARAHIPAGTVIAGANIPSREHIPIKTTITVKTNIRSKRAILAKADTNSKADMPSRAVIPVRAHTFTRMGIRVRTDTPSRERTASQTNILSRERIRSKVMSRRKENIPSHAIVGGRM